MDKPQYISAREARRRLHCAASHITRLVAAGKIGVRRLPGIAQDKLCAADVDRLAKAAITPARDLSPMPLPKSRKRRRTNSRAD
jgi:hypothetical protein